MQHRRSEKNAGESRKRGKKPPAEGGSHPFRTSTSANGLMFASVSDLPLPGLVDFKRPLTLALEIVRPSFFDFTINLVERVWEVEYSKYGISAMAKVSGGEDSGNCGSLNSNGDNHKFPAKICLAKITIILRH
ncbi:Hypothetical protein NTJ_06975 [Nesidiocoris tenuis]|uniref:Uncharacterized protein n=1 Tax=Nesidiocoris tenuis TaxID=355587 RepID=A0ABN7APM1_9HEMI|nr:Hypothetical protein NTJ_06975 [Nesidiocoris tenuis]